MPISSLIPRRLRPRQGDWNFWCQPGTAAGSPRTWLCLAIILLLASGVSLGAAEPAGPAQEYLGCGTCLAEARLPAPAGSARALAAGQTRSPAAGVLLKTWNGEVRVLYIRVDFTDAPGDPISTQAASDLLNVQMNDFWRNSSHGAVTCVGTVPPTLHLPYTKAEVQGWGDETLMSVVEQKIREAGYDLREYSAHVAAWKPVLFSYGGKAYIGGWGGWGGRSGSMATSNSAPWPMSLATVLA